MGNFVNGQNPHLSSTDNRRKVNIKEIYEKTWVNEVEEEKELLKNGFTWDEGYFNSSRKLELGYKTLIPPQEVMKEKSTGIIYVHGYGDSLRWFTQSNFVKFAQQGCLVTGIESEGHGLSEKTLGLFYDMNDLAQDVFEFALAQQEKYPLKHWFVYGVSMGGMITLLLSMKVSESVRKELKAPQVDGNILVAPMCKMAEEVKPPQVMVNSLLFLSKYFPSWSVVPSDFSDDLVFKRKEVKERASKDPLRYFGKPRMATAAALYRATTFLEKNLDKIEIPFIVLHGKKDIVTPHEASIELFKKSKVKEENKKIILPEEGWHALLLAEPEEDMRKYWNEIFTWVDERTQL